MEKILDARGVLNQVRGWATIRSVVEEVFDTVGHGGNRVRLRMNSDTDSIDLLLAFANRPDLNLAGKPGKGKEDRGVKKAGQNLLRLPAVRSGFGSIDNDSFAREVEGQVADADDVVEMIVGKKDRDRVVSTQQCGTDSALEPAHARARIQDEEVCADFNRYAHRIAELGRDPSSTPEQDHSLQEASPVWGAFSVPHGRESARCGLSLFS